MRALCIFTSVVTLSDSDVSVLCELNVLSRMCSPALLQLALNSKHVSPQLKYSQAYCSDGFLMLIELRGINSNR